jgi:hypothetical protein
MSTRGFGSSLLLRFSTATSREIHNDAYGTPTRRRIVYNRSRGSVVPDDILAAEQAIESHERHQAQPSVHGLKSVKAFRCYHVIMKPLEKLLSKG